MCQTLEKRVNHIQHSLSPVGLTVVWFVCLKIMCHDPCVNLCNMKRKSFLFRPNNFYYIDSFFLHGCRSLYIHLFNSTDKLIGIHLIIQTILISIVAQLPPASRAKLYSHFPCVFLPPPQFGDSQQLRLVRILRSTVMVRVGGGWMALDEFLVKNDPCRGEFSKSAIRNAALSTWLRLRRTPKFRNIYLLSSKSLLGKVQIGVIFSIDPFLNADCE